MDMEKYKKYVGSYAKRFYTSFEKENMAKIINFKVINGIDYFEMKDDDGNRWNWDVEDCVVITDEFPIIEDVKTANIFHKNYNGFNPYNIKNK